MNTADYLLEHGRDDDIAIIANRLHYTYADLHQASAQVVAEMLAHGVGPGDRVGIMGNNSLFWVAAYLATLKLGAVAAPFATTLPTELVSTMQAFVNCRVMLAEKRIQRRFASAFPAELPIIFDDTLQGSGAAVWPHLCLPVALLLSRGPYALRIATFKPILSRLSSISISAKPIE
jgi:long-chain acyl-CoA synthetase